MSTTHGRRHTPRVSRPRRSPAKPVLVLLWSGAAAVLLLWWVNNDRVVGTSEWLIGAARITGLLAGYGCAVLVGLMARVPALERRVAATGCRDGTRWPGATR